MLTYSAGSVNKHGQMSAVEHQAEPSSSSPWQALKRAFSPGSLRIKDLLFSTGDLPTNPAGIRQRYPRADRILESQAGQRPTVPDYHSINAVPPGVRVPKKIATPIQVEGKVWFANERTWVAYLDSAMLLGTFSLALFNASTDDVAKRFAYAYALISIGIVLYGYLIYQKRITMIKQRYPGHFGTIWGPVLICIALFIAVLANFVIRVRELQKQP